MHTHLGRGTNGALGSLGGVSHVMCIPDTLKRINRGGGFVASLVVLFGVIAFTHWSARLRMDMASRQFAIKFAVEFMGADRLLYASDHPWVEPRVILDALRSLKLPANEQDNILSGNARKLFQLA